VDQSASPPLFSGHPLVTDYLSGNLSAFFDYSPDEKGVQARLSDLAGLSFDRVTLVRCLREQNERHGCSPQTQANITLLEKPETVCITTGHQPILGGGPLYVAYKILSAVRLAHWISEHFQVPAVPLFWMGTDDDDLPEVIGAPSPFSAGYRFHPAKQAGMAGLLPNPSLKTTGLPAIEAGNWGHYHLRLLHRIFGAYGLILLDPLDEATQILRRPFFDTFLKTTGAFEAVTENTEKLKERGFRPQVNLRDNDRFLFLREGQYRKRVLHDTDLSGQSLLTSSLSRLLSLEFILPIAADVAGPSEIAYHAQTGKLYALLNRTLPPILPRLSATLYRPEDETSLKQCGISVAEVVENRLEAEKRAADFCLPGHIRQSLHDLSENMHNAFGRFQTELADIYPELSGAVAAAHRKTKGVESYLDKKIRTAAKRRFLKEDAAVAAAFHFLHPGPLQERAYHFIYFIETFPNLLNQIHREAEPFSRYHHLIPL